MSATEAFFREQREESEVKARIVQKYFDAWSRVISPSVKARGGRMAYLDTHAGPGSYEDGSPSTPLLVLMKAIAKADLCRMLVTVFNDMDSAACDKLTNAIFHLPGIEKLENRPIVMNKEIDSQSSAYFEHVSGLPTFSFIDPWGYKSLSRGTIKLLVSAWGSDCLFFFNYRRINAAFNNPAFASHIDALFGSGRAASLRAQLPDLPPHQREIVILEALAQALKELARVHVLPFVFKTDSGRRTSHCLVFVSKSEKGLLIMKDIMAAESSVMDQGVPTFTYSPADERTPLLFSLARPLEALESMLLKEFAGRTLTFEQLFLAHHPRYRYIRKNYRDVLLGLQRAGKIKVDPERRREGTFGPDVRVTFP